MKQLVLALIVAALANSGSAMASEFSAAGIDGGGTPSTAVDEYTIDDGAQENQVGLTQVGRLIWVNSFTVVAGQELITAVRVAWGLNPAGLPGQVLVWNDPNNDGNPTDVTPADLLSSAAIVSAAGTGTDNTFRTYPIPLANVGVPGERFFVGVCIDQPAPPPARFPAALDQTAPHNGRSWVGGGGTTVACNNPNGGTIGPMVNLNSIPGLNGDWMIRANATNLIPVEPTTWGSIKAIYTE